MLNAAVIGVGSMGKNHARVYSEIDGVNLVAVSDSRKDVCDSVAGQFNARAYTDYGEMLEKEKLDIVNVVVPTMMHEQVALDVIGAGVNVFVEKPISYNIESARKIIDAAKARKVKLTVGHIERFNPVVMKIKELLDRGVLGNVWSATITRKGPFPDRIRDVGVVIDLGVHDIDIMRHLFGTEIIRISAETERRIHTDHEDYLNAILRFESGVVGVMDVNWLTPVKIRQIHISGEKGMLSGDYIKQELTFYRNGNSGEVENIRIEKKEPLKTEIEAFRDCVTQDRHPAVNGIDGLISLEMVLNILKAAKTKNSVNCNGNGKPAEQEKGG